LERFRWHEKRPPAGGLLNFPKRYPGLLSLPDLLADALGLREQVEIVRSAGLGIGAGHVEAAEGVRAHHRSRALAVQVEVADVELAHGAVEFLARAGVDGAGQAELGVIGDFEGMVEVAR